MVKCERLGIASCLSLFTIHYSFPHYPKRARSFGYVGLLELEFACIVRVIALTKPEFPEISLVHYADKSYLIKDLGLYQLSAVSVQLSARIGGDIQGNQQHRFKGLSVGCSGSRRVPYYL